MRYRNMNKGLFAVAAVVAFFSLARPSAAQDFRGHGSSGSRERRSGGQGSRHFQGDFRGGIRGGMERHGGGFRGRGEAFRGRDGWRSRGYVAPYYAYDGYAPYAAPYPVYDRYAYDGYAPYPAYDGYAYGGYAPYPVPVYPRARVSVRLPVPRIHIPFPRFDFGFRR